MKILFLTASICCAALFLAACGEQENSNSNTPVQNTVKETAKAVDKTADHATGKAQLEQKKKMESKLNKIQQDQNRQLNQALQEK